MVLLEDDLDIGDLMAFVLNQNGIDPDRFSNGQHALDAMLADPPQLAVLDIAVPGLDGLEVLRALRRHPATAQVPVLLVSARARDHDIEHGRHAGADGYLVKPFRPRHLAQHVRQLLDNPPPQTRARPLPRPLPRHCCRLAVGQRMPVSQVRTRWL